MVLEYFGPAKVVFDFCRSAYRTALGRRKRLTNEQILECRAKWKPILDKRRVLEGGMDVTVRDIKRLDEYPDIKEGTKGISAWFRAGLVGTNETSVLLLLDWVSLNAEVIEFMQLEGMARKYAEGSENVALIGYVRFEQVVDIKWSGDDYNSRPSLFLYFDAGGGAPWSQRALCRCKTTPIGGGKEREWYAEICDFEAYRDACTKLGISVHG